MKGDNEKKEIEKKIQVNRKHCVGYRLFMSIYEIYLALFASWRQSKQWKMN